MQPLRKSGPRPPKADADGILRVIVKTLEPFYVPEGLRLRARIDDVMFTADLPAADLSRVEGDPGVASVSPSTTVGQIG